MKISAFIRKLEEMKSEHGDYEIGIADPDELVDGYVVRTEPFVCLDFDEDDHFVGFTIIDKETAAAFT